MAQEEGSPGPASGHIMVGWVSSDEAEAGGVGSVEVLCFFRCAFFFTE